MKKIAFVLLVLFATATISAQIRKINAQKSVISWTGKKVTGEHVGTITLKEGALIFKNGKVVGGSFVADMTTLSNIDQSGKDKIKLEGHLKSSDFFNVEAFKTSQLVFKSIAEREKNRYAVTADLTIKGITNPVKFDLLTKENSAVANLTVDRTKYGIQYGSGSFFDDLGDRTIYDNFELNVDLKF